MSELSANGINPANLVPPLRWSNHDNRDFYEGILKTEFKHFAAMGGLDDCCDVRLIDKHLKPTDAVLEVGAGYGRVLDYLIKKKFKNLSALEVTHKYYNLLKRRYGGRVKLFNTDLLSLKLDIKFDKILWLWSGISDFSKREQPQALKILAQHLKPNGMLFVDTFTPHPPSLNCATYNDELRLKNISGDIAYLYCPPTQDIQKYYAKTQISNLETLKYQTTTNQNRVIYILSRYQFL